MSFKPLAVTLPPSYIQVSISLFFLFAKNEVFHIAREGSFSQEFMWAVAHGYVTSHLFLPDTVSCMRTSPKLHSLVLAPERPCSERPHANFLMLTCAVFMVALSILQCLQEVSHLHNQTRDTSLT